MSLKQIGAIVALVLGVLSFFVPAIPIAAAVVILAASVAMPPS
jgi:hypothetical protein